MSDRTTDVLRQVLAAFNAHDLDAIMAHFADDCVFELSAGPDPWGKRFVGKDAVREGDGKTVEVTGCDVFTFRGDKIAVKNSYLKTRTS